MIRGDEASELGTATYVLRRCEAWASYAASCTIRSRALQSDIRWAAGKSLVAKKSTVLNRGR